MKTERTVAEINLDTAPPDDNYRFKSDLDPIHPVTQADILKIAKQLGFEGDALTLHWFDKELDNLLEWQARRLYWRLRVYRDDNCSETHFITCYSCSRDFDCLCSDSDHREGECAACHEGIGMRPIPQYDWKREGEIRISEIGIKRPRKFIDYK